MLPAQRPGWPPLRWRRVPRQPPWRRQQTPALPLPWRPAACGVLPLRRVTRATQAWLQAPPAPVCWRLPPGLVCSGATAAPRWGWVLLMQRCGRCSRRHCSGAGGCGRISGGRADAGQEPGPAGQLQARQARAQRGVGGRYAQHGLALGLAQRDHPGGAQAALRHLRQGGIGAVLAVEAAQPDAGLQLGHATQVFAVELQAFQFCQLALQGLAVGIAAHVDHEGAVVVLALHLPAAGGQAGFGAVCVRRCRRRRLKTGRPPGRPWPLARWPNWPLPARHWRPGG